MTRLTGALATVGAALVAGVAISALVAIAWWLIVFAVSV